MTVTRGLAAPVPPYPPRWWAHPAGPQFVGRAAELTALAGAWRAAVDGRRQAVLVFGEAGAGKSRLAAEASLRFAEQGAAVLVGCCMPDAPVAYEPFRAPLGCLLEDGPGNDVDQGLNAVRDLLAAPTRNPDASLPVESRALAPEAYEAAVRLLRRASANRPMALVIEDLHWATPSTLDLLGWIVRRAPDARMLILITSRNTRPELSDELRGTLTELYRQPGVSALELGGLTTDDIGRSPAGRSGAHRVGAFR